MGSQRIDVAGSGFTVLDRIYEGTRKTREEMGGSCANVLWSLATLQHHVVPVLRLGEDWAGHCLRQSFMDVGADTTFIKMRDDVQTPLLAQLLDRALGEHHFSSTCPETHNRFPRYSAIGTEDTAEAASVFANCAVFYADRLSEGIIDAMETVARRGGIVFFEPSEVGDTALFSRALASVSIIKCSQDRIRELDGLIGDHCPFRVVTEGAAGLRTGRYAHLSHLPAYAASIVQDTSGSGDMVSVGVIDHLVAVGARVDTLTIDDMIRGLRAGQRLAAANCAFVGARGIFRDLGSDSARHTLNN